MNQDVLLNEREVAERLRLSVGTLRQWRYTRRGPTWFKVGGAARYKAADIETFIKAGEHQAAA